ncbi:MAG TPA: glycosyltransferase family 4 protein [Nanoarchaeota archaeon]|nr:glycosyltransferase family 4 protein [Nanoarchaeota archaeon]HIH66272.1 glycosyltransferase family 4 protein [Nanoarchaeota archaeon]
MRMRIALINNIPEYWGAGKYAFMLHRGLSKLCNVDYIFLNYDDRCVEVNGKKIGRVNASNKLIFLKRASKLIKKYDIYHFTNQNLSFLIGGKKRWGKNVVTCHDIYPYLYPKNIIEKFSRRYLYSGLKKADFIVSDSEHTKNDLVDCLKIRPKKIKVVYLGVSNNFKKMNKARARKFFGIPNKARVILHIGEVNDKRKNTLRVFKAFLRLRQRMDHIILLRIGKGRIDHGGVINLYKISEKEMVAAYNAADVLLFPSLFEGFGIPPLEAMACGLPVITSNAASLPEVVGNAAIIVNPYEVNEMEREVFESLNDKRLSAGLIKKGLIRAKKFAWSKTASQIFKIYKELK